MMKIYGLSIPNFFAAIIVGLVLSFLLISILAPVDSVNYNEVKKDVSQSVQNDTLTPSVDTFDLALTALKLMVVVIMASCFLFVIMPISRW